MAGYIFKVSPFAAATGDQVPSRIDQVLSETIPSVTLNRAGSYSETPQAVHADATDRNNLTIGTKVIVDTVVVMPDGNVTVVPVENVQTDQGLQPTQNATQVQDVYAPPPQDYYIPSDVYNPLGNLLNQTAGGGVPEGNQGDGGANFYWNPDEIQHQSLYVPPTETYSETQPTYYGYNETPTYSYVPPQSQEQYYVEPEPNYGAVFLDGTSSW